MADGSFDTLLSALRLATALLGATFVAVAARAYLRKRTWPMMTLTVAGVFLTGAVLFAWWASSVAGWAPQAVDLGEAGLLLLGFVWLIYSLIVPESPIEGT